MPPVEDHPVHESTRIGADYRYGCNNVKRTATGYYAQDRQYHPNGTFTHIMRHIENVMSKECRYDYSSTDPACAGCKEKQHG